jgi:mono/diheme cytochrome c family protein
VPEEKKEPGRASRTEIGAGALIGTILLAGWGLCWTANAQMDSHSLRGAELFATRGCAQCHNAEALSLTGIGKRYDRRALADFLKTPTPPMPTPELSDEERMLLADYLLEAFP